ncbi:MAG: PEP-CTERM sorting domain-containing protein, partial [Lentisphaeraceae bacterium]|nr:PEP-CTERM sorting domain-containing protein [Lentisphaeraceae bacterium]
NAIEDNYHGRVTFENLDITFDNFILTTATINFTLMEIRGAASIAENIYATPEPSSYALLMLGLCGLAYGKRNQKKTIA